MLYILYTNWSTHFGALTHFEDLEAEPTISGFFNSFEISKD